MKNSYGFIFILIAALILAGCTSNAPQQGNGAAAIANSNAPIGSMDALAGEIKAIRPGLNWDYRVGGREDYNASRYFAYNSSSGFFVLIVFDEKADADSFAKELAKNAKGVVSDGSVYTYSFDYGLTITDCSEGLFAYYFFMPEGYTLEQTPPVALINASVKDSALKMANICKRVAFKAGEPVAQKPAEAQNKTAENITEAKNTTEVSEVAKKNPIVMFETTKGNFTAEIYVNEAPITGNNFMGLVRRGFYDNLTFHRVEPGFVVQGGDPKGDGTGGSGVTIPLEIKPDLKHTIGTLAMARAQDPNSASSQFYIVTGEASFLDGQYAVFGHVLGNGMDVVNKIKIGDRMTKVYEQK